MLGCYSGGQYLKTQWLEGANYIYVCARKKTCRISLLFPAELGPFAGQCFPDVG